MDRSFFQDSDSGVCADFGFPIGSYFFAVPSHLPHTLLARLGETASGDPWFFDHPTMGRAISVTGAEANGAGGGRS